MSKSPNEIAARVIAQLAQTAPGLSCEPGTVVRKIIDANAEAISEAYVDQYLVGSILDIDTKVGLELEQFVGLWGVGRLQGKAATGVVRVTLTTASTQDYQIPLGTQFYTKSVVAGATDQLFFSSTQAMVLVAGTLSIDVPVQCASVGTVGNVAPGTITFLASAIGSGAATNLNAMTGGVDVETDSELRQRFKDTLLRNMAGSTDFYRALCLQNNYVSRVVVFGPTTLYRTQIEAPSVTLPLSLGQDVKYVWCLTPEARVLTASLDWVPVGSLRPGDDIVGFDEHLPPGKRGRKRQWRRSTVTHTSTTPAPTFTITTNTGTAVTSTGDHMWLVSKRPRLGNKGRKRGVVRDQQKVQWIKTKDLVPGDEIRYIPPWDEDSSFDAGWMAGLVDGEASYNQYSLTIMQNDGPVFDQIIDILNRNKFDYKVSRTRGGFSPEARCNEILLRGGMEARLRFFGLFKSIRLTPKFLESFYGRCIVGKGCSFATVVAVEEAGIQEVVELSTSTGTLVAEGLLSHNTDQHSCFANIGQEDEVFYSPIYDYALSSGASPVFTRNESGDIASGAIVDLEFQYVTRSSRNDPVNGITNKVDVFVDGINPVSVTEKTVITSAALSSNSADDYWTGRFERVGSAGNPSAGNRFMRLGSVPVVTFPSTISVGSTIYSQGVHYHLLRDISTTAGSHQETSGIEWDPSGPSDSTSLVLTYVYNEVPEVLSHVLSAAKQITTDVMVHQAKFVYIRPCLSIRYDRSYSVSTTNSAIDERLKSYFAAMSYGAHIRFSVLAMAVQQVMGVVDVTVTMATDSPTAFGIQAYHNSTDPDPATVHDVDFKLADNELPIFMETVVLRKAAD
mgnify:CR=1 FL=1